MRAGRALAPFAVALGRLRADPVFAAVLFAVVAATAFLFALVPQVFDHLSDRSLEQALARANPLERNVEVTRAGRIPTGPEADPLARAAAAGATYERRLPATVRAAAGEPRFTFETLRYTLVTPPGAPSPGGTVRYLTLRSPGDAPQHLEQVSGRPPDGDAGVVRIPFDRQESGPLLELALSGETARQLSVGVGDRLYAFPALDDPLARTVPASDQPGFAVRVAGIVRSDDLGWFVDSRLARARTRDTDTARYVYAYAYVPPAAYDDLVAATSPLPFRYEWRYAVDPTGFGSAGLEGLAADVRRIDAEFGQTSYGQTLGLGVRTGLTRILDRFTRDRDAAAAVLAVGAISLLAVALAVLGLLAALAAERRSAVVELMRSRGGSLGQTLGAQALEGAMVGLPAALLGLAAATALVPGRGSGLALALVLGIVAATALLFAAFVLAPARRALSASERGDQAVTRLSPPRLGLELAVAAASLGGAYLLRRRGLASEGGFDPYLAAAPLLVGLAAGLLALRLYPLPLRGLAWSASARDDLVPALGLRRLARQPTAAGAALAVVLLGVAVGVFSAAMAGTIGAAQEAAGAAQLTPLATGTHRTFELGVAAAGLYAAGALALAPLLAGRSRRRDLTYLRALGLSRRETLGLAAVELVPPVLGSVILGIALGLGIAYLVEPGLDLGSLGAGTRPALKANPLASALLFGALALAAFAAALAAGTAAARTSISRALRMGER